MTKHNLLVFMQPEGTKDSGFTAIQLMYPINCVRLRSHTGLTTRFLIPGGETSCVHTKRKYASTHGDFRNQERNLKHV